MMSTRMMEIEFYPEELGFHVDIGSVKSFGFKSRLEGEKQVESGFEELDSNESTDTDVPFIEDSMDYLTRKGS